MRGKTMAYAGARLALTFDDAPSVREPGLAEQFDPARMDRIREALQECEVRHAVAFVISDWAQGSEAEMERWPRATRWATTLRTTSAAVVVRLPKRWPPSIAAARIWSNWAPSLKGANAGFASPISTAVGIQPSGPSLPAS
jgi:hypothetical protein